MIFCDFCLNNPKFPTFIKTLRQSLTPKSLILLNLKISYQITKKCLEYTAEASPVFVKINSAKSHSQELFSQIFFEMAHIFNMPITVQAPRTLNELAQYPKN